MPIQIKRHLYKLKYCLQYSVYNSQSTSLQRSFSKMSPSNKYPELVSGRMYISERPLILWVYRVGERNLWLKAKEISSIMECTANAVRDHVLDTNKKSWDELVKQHDENRTNVYAEVEARASLIPGTMFINIPGILQLMMNSQKPFMRSFQFWMMKEMLPALRNNDDYYQSERGESVQPMQTEAIESGRVYLATITALIKENPFERDARTNRENERMEPPSHCFRFIRELETMRYDEMTEFIHLVLDECRTRRTFFFVPPNYLPGFAAMCRLPVKFN